MNLDSILMEKENLRKKLKCYEMMEKKIEGFSLKKDTLLNEIDKLTESYNRKKNELRNLDKQYQSLKMSQVHDDQTQLEKIQTLKQKLKKSTEQLQLTTGENKRLINFIDQKKEDTYSKKIESLENQIEIIKNKNEVFLKDLE